MGEIEKKKIEAYVDAYNAFDIGGMLEHLHENVVFENVTNGQVDLRTEGISAFKKQAEKAKQFFSSRHQKIESWTFDNEIVTIEIDYEGVLAIDLPGGAKAGDTLAMKGRSEFTFKDDKISSIKDFS